MRKPVLAAAGLLAVALVAAAVYLAYERGLIGAAGSAAAQVLPADENSMAGNQLAMGTLLLEGTDLAVTPEQATKLLPLWQMLSALYGSSNAAQEEIAAVVKQLRQIMTAEQLSAIESARSNPQDMTKAMESFGLEWPRPQVTGTPPAWAGQFGGEFQPPQDGGLGTGAGGGALGVVPGGGFGGGQAPFDEAAMAAARATRQASGESVGSPGAGRANTMVLQAVIQLLQARSGA